jgi:hypothetical protein
MWLYPLPAFVALLLWGFVFLSPEKGFKAAGFAVLGAGVVAYLVIARRKAEWPFTAPA